MRNRIGIFIALGLMLSLAAVSCSNESADSNATARQGDAVAKANSDPGTVDAGDAAEPVRVVQSSGSPSADAYEAVLGEIRALERTATTMQKRAEALEKIEGLLTDFIEDYDGSPESLDARFQLGILYVSLARMDNAAEMLAAYVDGAGQDQGDKLAYAEFYLAEAYKGAEDFANARKHYTRYIEKYSQLNPKMLAAATAALGDLDTLRKLKIGGEPIPFEVTDLNGKTLSLDQFKGKVVLLDFWATWCAPCKVEMPNVIKVHKKFNKQGFEIVGISLDSDRTALESYIRASGMSWPQHFDGAGWNNGVAAKYKVRSIPATYLIDRKGKIRYRSLRGKALEEAVELLVNESA